MQYRQRVSHVAVKVILNFPSLPIYWTMLKHTNIKLVLHLWTKSFLGITYCVSMHCRPLSAMLYLRYYASVHKWNCYFFLWILPCLLKILFFNYVNLCVCVSLCMWVSVQCLWRRGLVGSLAAGITCSSACKVLLCFRIVYCYCYCCWLSRDWIHVMSFAGKLFFPTESSHWFLHPLLVTD